MEVLVIYLTVNEQLCDEAKWNQLSGFHIWWKGWGYTSFQLSLFSLLSNVKPDLNQGIFVHIALPGVCPRASKFCLFFCFSRCAEGLHVMALTRKLFLLLNITAELVKGKEQYERYYFRI